MYEYHLFSILSLLAALYFAFIGVYVISINSENSSNRLFFFMSLGMTFWGLGEGLMRASVSPSTAMFWATYFIGLGSAMWSTTFVHFWLQFSEIIKKTTYKKLILFLIYTPFSIFTLIRYFDTKILITSVTSKYWGFTPIFTNIYEIYGFFVILYSMLVCIWAIKNSFFVKNELRTQYLTVGIGALFTVIVGATSQLFAPMFGRSIPELTVISSVFFVSAIAYNMKNFRLLTVSSETVAKNIVNTINDFVIAVDKDLKITFVNKEVLDISGHSEIDLIYQPIQVLLTNDLFRLDLDEISQKLPISNLRSEFFAKNRDIVPVVLNISALRDGAGGIIGFVLIARDVQQLDELAKDLQEKNEELETFNKIATNRELKMIKLKQIVDEQKIALEIGKNI